MTFPKKQLGQHWLKDEQTLEYMALCADLSTKDTVLEIGPGQGDLTSFLLSRAFSVTAIEVDKSLIKGLKEKFKDKTNFNLINSDILKFDFNKISKNYKIVANIPYYLSSNLIRIISETPNPPSLAVLLLQKEVAQRVAAMPGEMSILSVTAQMYFEPTLGQIVKAELFIPSPKVDSRVLILKRRPEPLFGKQNPKELFRVVKAGFSERRKKLRSSLSGGLQISKESADELLKNANLDGNLRAQNLSLDDWIKLGAQIDKT